MLPITLGYTRLSIVFVNSFAQHKSIPLTCWHAASARRSTPAVRLRTRAFSLIVDIIISSGNSHFEACYVKTATGGKRIEAMLNYLHEKADVLHPKPCF